MADKKIKIREWLNKDKAMSAHIIVDGVTRENGLGNPYVDMDISIADCYRKAVIDIGFNTKAGKKKMLAKVDKMINALQQARDFMEDVDV